eukprot:gene10040-13498_t
MNKVDNVIPNEPKAKYAAILEIQVIPTGKAVGGVINPNINTKIWVVRTFKLNGQVFDYYEGERLKGSINTANSKSTKIEPIDGKLFPFQLETMRETILLNATSEEIREKCIEILNYSSKSAIWALTDSNRKKSKRALIEDEQKMKSYQMDAALLEEELAKLKALNEKNMEEMLKSGKLKYALRAGMLRAAKEIGCLIIQSVLRRKIAYLRVARIKAQIQFLKEEKIRMYPIVCATKIQTRVRMRIARKKMLVLRAEMIKLRQQRALEKLENGKRTSILLANAKYYADLEIKSNGRVKNWVLRTFILTGESFEYYDGDKLRGKINLKGSKIMKIESTHIEADNKEFAVCIDTGKDKIYLNASDQEAQQKCVDILSNSSKSANWAINGGIESGLSAKELILREDRKIKLAKASSINISGKELDNLKKKVAKESEEIQQLGEKNEILKETNNKKRFLRAKRNSIKDVAYDSGIIFIQAWWRGIIAKKRVKLLKSKGFPTEKAKSKRGTFLVPKASFYNSKATFSIITNNDELNFDEKFFPTKKSPKPPLTPETAAIMIQKICRSFLSFHYVSKLLSYYPQIVKVSLDSIQNIPSSVDPVLAYVSGMVLQTIEQQDHVKDNNRMSIDLRGSASSMISDFQQEHAQQLNGKVTSLFHTSVSIPHNVNNKSNHFISAAENIYVVSPIKLSCISLTIVDNKDEFIGQAGILVSKYARLFKPTAISMELPLEPFSVPIYNGDSETIIYGKNNPPPNSTIKVKLTIPSKAYSMCGWVWKVSESMLSSTWKKRWMIIINNNIQYFNSPTSLDKPKNIIHCSDVHGLREVTYKNKTGISISYKNNGIENNWTLSFDGIDQNIDQKNALFIKNMWLRKINRVCGNIGINNRLSSSESPKKGSMGGEDSPVNATTTKVPLSKRFSIKKWG